MIHGRSASGSSCAGVLMLHYPHGVPLVRVGVQSQKASGRCFEHVRIPVSKPAVRACAASSRSNGSRVHMTSRRRHIRVETDLPTVRPSRDASGPRTRPVSCWSSGPEIS